MITRRRFLKASCAAGAACLLHDPARAAADDEPKKPKSRPDVVIYQGEYPGWPWVSGGKDGELYCVFREGTAHDYSASGKCMLATSSDNGKTWSDATVIVDQPMIDDRNVAIARLPDGDLLATYNSYTAAKESQAMSVRSTDGGRTWSSPALLGEPNTRTKSAVVVLKSGRLLLPYYIAPGNGALAAWSKDNGRSWTTVRVPDTEGFVGDEWDVLEVEPGRLVGIIRNSHARTDGTFWMSESRDEGQTWSVSRATNVRSLRHTSPAQITRQGKSPTIIYSDQRMVSVSAVKTHDPDFLKWDIEQRLPCYLYNADQSPILDGSYPVSVQVGDHERLIVDYEIREQSRQVAGYFVTFPKNW